MDRPQPDKAILLALAALHHLCEELGAEPLDRPIWLRALLGTLHALSGGDRQPYVNFWRTCHVPRSQNDVDTAASYIRRTHARTQWYAIVRAFGIEPLAPAFNEAIRELINPDTVLIAALRNAVYVREVIGTKGHLRSERGRELAPTMIDRLGHIGGHPMAHEGPCGHAVEVGALSDAHRRNFMADDKADRGPADRSRISLSEDYEVRYWTKKFGVSRDELTRAVDAVGSNAEAVGTHLNRGR